MSLTDLGLNGGYSDGRAGETHRLFGKTINEIQDRNSDPGHHGLNYDRFPMDEWVVAAPDRSPRSVGAEYSEVTNRAQIPGVLPMLPSMGGRATTTAPDAVPKKVATSLTSLTTLLHSESPVSRVRRRASFLDLGADGSNGDGSLRSAIRAEEAPKQQQFQEQESHDGSNRGSNTDVRFLKRDHYTRRHNRAAVTNLATDDSDSNISLDSSIRRQGHQTQKHDLHLRQLSKHAMKLKERRTVVSNLIKELVGIRRYTDPLRQQHEKAARAFVAAVMPLLANVTDLSERSKLHELLAAMQDFRGQHHEAGLRTDEVAKKLHGAERELDMQERVFYSVAAGYSAQSDDSDSDLDSTYGSGRSAFSEDDSVPRPAYAVPYELRGISGDRGPDVHPALAKLQKATRDLRLTEEFMEDLEMKKQILESMLFGVDNAELRKAAEDAKMLSTLETRFAQALSQDDEDFLQSYESVAETARNQKRSQVEDIARLTTDCRKRRIPLEEGEGLDVHDLSSQQDSDIDLESDNEEDSLRGSATLAHPVFPILLANPSSLLEDDPKTAHQALARAVVLPATDPDRQRRINEARREHSIQNLLRGSRPSDKADWLNRWLLHKLHISAMEAELIYTVAQDHLHLRDLTKWQRDVLRFWPRDMVTAPRPPAELAGAKSTNDSVKLMSDVRRRFSESDLHMNGTHSRAVLVTG